MVDSFKEAAEQAKKDGRIADYDIENGDGSVNQQVSQINGLILKQVDAIAINAASPTALNGVIEKACAASIKVIAFDSIWVKQNLLTTPKQSSRWPVHGAIAETENR